MKHKRKLLPAWLIIVLDLVLIGSYVGLFYGLYYRTPRQLESSGIQTAQKESTVSSSGKEVTSSDKSADIASADNSTTGTTTTGTSTTDNSTTGIAETTGSSEDWASKYAEHFTNKVKTTENSYNSSDISITVNKYTQGSGSNIVTYYVADIYVADIKCLQSGFADSTYGVGYTADVLNMDSTLGAILAINGDYYGNGGDGVVIRNGEVYRTSANGSDVCVLYYDGTMKTFSSEEFDVNQAIADGAYQAWCFGPKLLDEDGNSMSQFTADGHVQQNNPRSAIGYYEPGHYCLVVVDGRQSGYSVGMTLSQFSELFKELGCSAAYNLDGGKSSEMTFNDAYVNRPADGGREVSDCIFLKEVE